MGWVCSGGLVGVSWRGSGGGGSCQEMEKVRKRESGRGALCVCWEETENVRVRKRFWSSPALPSPLHDSTPTHSPLTLAVRASALRQLSGHTSRRSTATPSSSTTCLCHANLSENTWEMMGRRCGGGGGGVGARASQREREKREGGWQAGRQREKEGESREGETVGGIAGRKDRWSEVRMGDVAWRVGRVGLGRVGYGSGDESGAATVWGRGALMREESGRGELRCVGHGRGERA